MAKFKRMGRKAEVMHLIDYFAMKCQWNKFGNAIFMDFKLAGLQI
jgi:hypothetical protein